MQNTVNLKRKKLDVKTKNLFKAQMPRPPLTTQHRKNKSVSFDLTPEILNKDELEDELLM